MSNMMNNTEKTNLILKPLKGMRGKRYDTLKGCTVTAMVDLADGYRDDYHHPVLTLKKVREYDTGDSSDYELMSVRFQRHNVDRNSTRGWTQPRMRGFLRGARGCWSHTYGGEVRGNAERLDYLTTGLGLIERANDAVRKDDALSRKLGRLGCDMTTLIVGLRKIGVTVVIRNAKPVKEYSLVAA